MPQLLDNANDQKRVITLICRLYGVLPLVALPTSPADLLSQDIHKATKSAAANQGASLFFFPALFFSVFSFSFRAASLAISCAVSLRPSLLREIYKAPAKLVRKFRVSSE